MFENNKYAQDEYEKMKNLCRETYYKNSKITDMVNIFSDLNYPTEYALGRRVNIPKKWFTDISHYPNLVFEDLGRYTANYEKWFLVKHIPEVLKNVEYKEMEITQESIINSIFSMEYPNRITLFMPLPFYMKFHIDWRLNETLKNMPLWIKINEVIWSNKYIDFDYVMILDSDAIHFYYDRDIDQRLKIEDKELDESNIDFTVKTDISFKIDDENKIKLFSPTNTPNKH
ncbi:MAG: hypothetical protein ACTSQY_05365 [Candidatus Odinarchaeia archaeon]